MTNHEYEKACVDAALGRYKLAAVDAKITETEQALVYLLHQRREIVNQYDLNKKPVCEHFFVLENSTIERCFDCGVIRNATTN